MRKTALLILFLLPACSESVPMTVTSFSWKRTLNLEEYMTVIESGSYIPTGGREISRRKNCGPRYNFFNDKWSYECDTVYTYEIERWIFQYMLESGSDKRSPFWPVIETKPNQRLTNPKETYTVRLKDDKKKQYAFNCSEAEWKTYGAGERVVGKIGLFGIRELVRLEKE